MKWPRDGHLIPAIRRPPGETAPPSFLELFFDLAFILVFAQLAHELVQNLTWHGAFEMVLLLLAAWWVWVLTVWLTDLFNPRLPKIQLLVILIMLGVMAMALVMPTAFEARALFFAGAYLAIHVARDGFLIPATRVNRTVQARSIRVIFWHGLTSPLWIGGAIAHGDIQLVLWAAALVIEYVSATYGWPTPGLGRTELASRIFTGPHLYERHRQIFVVALGEMILSVGLRVVGGPLPTESVAAAGAAFVGALLVFQIYINRVRELIAGPSIVLLEQIRRGILMSHSHLVMVAGVVVMAVAADLAARDPLQKENVAWTVCIAAGPALFLFGSSLFDLLVHRSFRPRLIGMLVLLAMTPALHLLPMFAVLILIDVVLAATLVVELAVAHPRSLSPGAQVAGGRGS
ncbi:low temperature requirement protein LtrA [Micromonospora pisi]|uniref:Low temperature requirement protein LtrA n=1 Tax=Micromonospora pisi TaxID=589240 RepID=A0A495JM57_9ACTN|nr:low temperature requirement protein A [Micromonospora pisi]RKR89638.1 low temperature requirement protein LtrA [Micromonospora pisi]